jgi:hypothetical protein
MRKPDTVVVHGGSEAQLYKAKTGCRRKRGRVFIGMIFSAPLESGFDGWGEPHTRRISTDIGPVSKICFPFKDDNIFVCRMPLLCSLLEVGCAKGIAEGLRYVSRMRYVNAPRSVEARRELLDPSLELFQRIGKRGYRLLWRVQQTDQFVCGEAQ